MATRPGQERDVHPRAPLRPGYVYVKKGNPYITRHCRQLTLSTGKDLFKVVDDKNRTLGLRVPAAVHATVLAADASTKPARLSATAARDARTLSDARAVLLELFPAMPAADVDAVVAHAFRKNSGRVGRNGSMSLEEKVTLGVRAHVRHAHTAYEELMRSGVERDVARWRVAGELEEVVRRWQGLPEKSPRRMSFRNVGGSADKGKTKKKSEGVLRLKEELRRAGGGANRRTASSVPAKAKKQVRKPVKRVGTGVRKAKPRNGRGLAATKRTRGKRISIIHCGSG